MIYYKDIITNQPRRTFAEPRAVVKGGPIGAEGLLCIQKRTGNEVWIPRYLLIGASLAHFHALKGKADT